ncbi:premnaspirodiene oxygenase-like [Mercurialis annua]|uniref:premnaspirodiene oxygenase-like n=1 Tax=Mercurialis annua TaxID=3986 RepID=UPI00215F3570|nr:premnaspirodiene oxygenase-like [Mercurialis annua]
MASLQFSPSNIGAFTTTKIASPASTAPLHLLPSSSYRLHRMKVHCQTNPEDQKSRTVAKTLPPGPMKLPIIGNLHNLAGNLPHLALSELAKEYGPIMHLQMGEISSVVVSDAKMAKEVLKTHDLKFAQRPQLLVAQIVIYDGKDIAFSPYGEYYKQIKKISSTELLGPKRVQAFASLRENEVDKLIDSVRRSVGKPMDFGENVYRLTNVIICKAAFGEECKEQDAVIKLGKEATDLAGGFNIADLFPSLTFLHGITGEKRRFEKLRDEFDRMLTNIVEDHMKKLLTKSGNSDESEREDLVDSLLKLQASGHFKSPLTMDHIKAVVLDLFIAGTETSSTTVEWAMSEMIRNPRVLKKAQEEVREALKGKETIRDADVQDLKYLNLIMKETLRLHPPVPMLLPRESNERCEIAGYELPVKTKMIVNAYAIGRDPKVWRDAEEFKPERFLDMPVDFIGMDFEYIPFGGGRRICPGMAFGVANMQLPLARLLYHFDWTLPDGATPENLDMSETFGASISRKTKLYLIPTLYEPSKDESTHYKEAMKVLN